MSKHCSLPRGWQAADRVGCSRRSRATIPPARGAGARPFAIVAADFNGDGRADVAAANFVCADVSILIGHGDGTFAPQTVVPVGGRSVGTAAGEFRHFAPTFARGASGKRTNNDDATWSQSSLFCGARVSINRTGADSSPRVVRPRWWS